MFRPAQLLNGSLPEGSGLWEVGCAVQLWIVLKQHEILEAG
jgi:hypothetical protein